MSKPTKIHQQGDSFILEMKETFGRKYMDRFGDTWHNKSNAFASGFESEQSARAYASTIREIKI